MAETSILRPIIVLGAPRSGTTILRNCLALHPDLWHLPGESHEVLEGPFDPADRHYESNRVEANDVSDALAASLRDAFAGRAINLSAVSARPDRVLRANSVTKRITAKVATRWMGARSIRNRPREIRFLEKTPKNMLRVPLLARIFPDASYVLLTRNAPDNIDSLIDGWHAVDRFGPFTRQRFARSGYPIARELNLHDYSSKWWKFALVPEWRELRGKGVADVAAWQYFQCNRTARADLSTIDPARVRHIKHEEFVHAPVTTIRDLFEWAELAASPVAERYAASLPAVNSTARSSGGTARGPERTLRHHHEVHSAIASTPGLIELHLQLGYSCGDADR